MTTLRTVITHTHRPATTRSWWTLMLHRVHDFGEEEPHLRRDRPSWIGLLNQVEAFVHRGEPELTVEQDDVVGVDLGAGREQLHRKQVPRGRDVDQQLVA